MAENFAKIANEAKSAAPAASWGPFADLRKVIVHAYWQIDRTVAAAAIGRPLSSEAGRLMAFARRSRP
jgi:uncharacterized protein with HEPN domain